MLTKIRAKSAALLSRLAQKIEPPRPAMAPDYLVPLAEMALHLRANPNVTSCNDAEHRLVGFRWGVPGEAPVIRRVPLTDIKEGGPDAQVVADAWRRLHS